MKNSTNAKLLAARSGFLVGIPPKGWTCKYGAFCISLPAELAGTDPIVGVTKGENSSVTDYVAVSIAKSRLSCKYLQTKSLLR